MRLGAPHDTDAAYPCVFRVQSAKRAKPRLDFRKNKVFFECLNLENVRFSQRLVLNCEQFEWPTAKNYDRFFPTIIFFGTDP